MRTTLKPHETQPPIRVRVLAGALDYLAGSHAYHLELVQRLAARGHAVSVVCFTAPERLADVCEVVELRPPDYTDLRAAWRVAPWLKHRWLSRAIGRRPLSAPELVIGGEHLMLQAHYRRFPQAVFFYVPHSLTVAHEIDSYNLPPMLHWSSKWLYGRVQRWALRTADRTVRFTPWAAQALEASYGPAATARVVVNPMPIAPPPEVRREAAGDATRLLFVGRLVASKNVDLALRALAAVGGPFRWRLDVVGDGPERDRLQALAADCGIADRVHFAGFQPQPEAWYRRADLLVFPSRLESCGLAVLEAMGHAVPCLGIRADGVKYLNPLADFITQDATGLLASDEAAFAGQLQAALENPRRLARLGDAARAHVLRHHGWDAHLDNYEALAQDGSRRPTTAEMCVN